MSILVFFINLAFECRRFIRDVGILFLQVLRDFLIDLYQLQFGYLVHYDPVVILKYY